MKITKKVYKSFNVMSILLDYGPPIRNNNFNWPVGVVFEDIAISARGS